MSGDAVSDKLLMLLMEVTGNVPLTKFASPIGFASWGELSSPTWGEDERRRCGPVSSPLVGEEVNFSILASAKF